MTEIILSRSVDEFVPRDRWIASLSNGETIFQDNRPDQESPWLRLSSYIKQNSLAITQLRLQIAGLEVKLPANQDGYIQKKKAYLFSNSRGGTNLCLGYIQDGMAGIYYLGSDHDSYMKIEADPGPPFSIYRHDIECSRPNCCKSLQ